MDGFSLEILQRTVDLALDAIPPDETPNIIGCVITIRDYVKSPDAIDERELLSAILELLEIARSKSQFLIAARLSPIARQLRGRYGKLDVA